MLAYRADAADDDDLAATSVEPLPHRLLEGWRNELRHADSKEARAHWWVESHWVACGGVRGLLGATLRHIIDGLRASLHRRLRTAWVQSIGVEFWVQRRPVNGSMHLHYDAPPAASQIDMAPTLSVVLYLTDEGSPTLVLEQRAHEAWGRHVRGRLGWPHSGTFLAFDGSLLHGIVGLEDCVAEAGHALAAGQLGRSTLIFNFWRRRPLGLPSLPRVLFPRLGPSARGDEPAEGAAPDAGALRLSRWAAASLRPRRLLFGMPDRQAAVELELPPLEARGQHGDCFTTSVRCAEASA